MQKVHYGPVLGSVEVERQFFVHRVVWLKPYLVPAPSSCPLKRDDVLDGRDY